LNDLFLYGSVALALLLLFPLYRIVRGPTIYDRLVGAAMMGTKTTVLLLLMGFAVGRADMYVDISLGYGLALLVGHLVVAKYLEKSAERGEWADPEAEHGVAAQGDADDAARREVAG
jgi:multicomponent Na+:H+ antiporter subunit F